MWEGDQTGCSRQNSDMKFSHGQHTGGGYTGTTQEPLGSGLREDGQVQNMPALHQEREEK